MLIRMDPSCGEPARQALAARFAEAGFNAYAIRPQGEPVLYVPGCPPARAEALSKGARGVLALRPVRAAYGLVSRELGVAPEMVTCGAASVGGPSLALMAGPCAVEGEAQLMACAKAARAAGATFLRGGAFKPRTSPHAFTGLKEQGLRLLAAAGAAHGLAVVTEVMDAADVPLVARYADMLQVGARNMQNFTLLRAVGEQAKPVLLKRGLSATYEEWLLAAEHIRTGGNDRIVLCERGIRTFERATRNTLDLAAVPVLKTMTSLPVVIDPSHGTGRRDAVLPMARAAVAAGADGIMVECHPEPSAAWSDGPQSLPLEDLPSLARSIAAVAEAVGRIFPTRP